MIDDDEFVHYNGTSWVTALDLSALPGTTPEQMAFYAPGRIRPNRTTFMYVPAIEKTIVGGMVGSTASLEVAPSGGNLVFSINANGSTGTITFADGSATGTISFDPSDAVLPVGSAFLVTAPSNTYEAEGLTLSIACKDRGLTNG